MQAADDCHRLMMMLLVRFGFRCHLSAVCEVCFKPPGHLVRGGRWAGTRQPSRPNPLHASTACAQLIHPDCASVFLRPQMVDIIIINFFFLCVAIVGRTSAIVCLNEGSSLCPMHQWWASTAMDTIMNWFCVGIHAWWPCTLLVWDAKCTCANICRTCWRDMDSG